jgi:hypothetical protein
MGMKVLSQKALKCPKKQAQRKSLTYVEQKEILNFQQHF